MTSYIKSHGGESSKHIQLKQKYLKLIRKEFQIEYEVKIGHYFIDVMLKKNNVSIPVECGYCSKNKLNKLIDKFGFVIWHPYKTKPVLLKEKITTISIRRKHGIRKSMNVRFLQLLNALDRLKFTTVSGLAKETKFSYSTIEHYMSIITNIQNNPKIRAIQNPAGEIIYGLETELESFLPKESTGS